MVGDRPEGKAAMGPRPCLRLRHQLPSHPLAARSFVHHQAAHLGIQVIHHQRADVYLDPANHLAVGPLGDQDGIGVVLLHLVETAPYLLSRGGISQLPAQYGKLLGIG